MTMARWRGPVLALGTICSLPAMALSRADTLCAQASSVSAQARLTHAGLIDQTKVDNTRSDISLLASQSLAGSQIRAIVGG